MEKHMLTEYDTPAAFGKQIGYNAPCRNDNRVTCALTIGLPWHDHLGRFIVLIMAGGVPRSETHWLKFCTKVHLIKFIFDHLVSPGTSGFDRWYLDNFVTNFMGLPNLIKITNLPLCLPSNLHTYQFQL